jgi:hypothetical protein
MTLTVFVCSVFRKRVSERGSLGTKSASSQVVSCWNRLRKKTRLMESIHKLLAMLYNLASYLLYYNVLLDRHIGFFGGASSLLPLKHLYPFPRVLLGHDRIPFVQQQITLNGRQSYLDIRPGNRIGKLVGRLVDVEFQIRDRRENDLGVEIRGGRGVKVFENLHCLCVGSVVESDIDVKSTRSTKGFVEIVGEVCRCKEYRVFLQRKHNLVVET